MSKFDITKFLVENKLTETGRRKQRQHFGEISLSKKVVLNEMQMKADPDSLDEWDSDDDLVAQERGYDLDGSDSGSDDSFDRKFDDSLKEAGYTDMEDDDFDDVDFGMFNDKSAEAAFKRDRDSEEAEDDGLDDMVRDDAPEGDEDDDFEDPEQMSDVPEEAPKENLAQKLKYDESKVEFDMDESELNDYLHGFRRPQVALKVLQRALNQARIELDNSPAVKKLYLILSNGFYKTSAFRRGNTIATIRR